MLVVHLAATQSDFDFGDDEGWLERDGSDVSLDYPPRNRRAKVVDRDESTKVVQDQRSDAGPLSLSLQSDWRSWSHAPAGDVSSACESTTSIYLISRIPCRDLEGEPA